MGMKRSPGRSGSAHTALTLGAAALLAALVGAVAIGRDAGPPPMPHEVAPVVTHPVEPATRDLEPGEAASMLEADWLYQAEGRPLVRRARQEIGWAREMAQRLATGPHPVDVRRELAELAGLEAQLPAPPAAALATTRLPATPDALAHWNFEEEKGGAPIDATAHRRNGIGGEFPAREPGVAGLAAAWSGAGAVDCGPTPAEIAAARYTLTAWISATSQEADILGSGVGAGHFLFMSYQGVVRGHHWTDADGNVLDGKTRVDDGAWHHVAMVVDGKTVALYVDGRLDGSRPFVGAPKPITAHFTLGGRGEATSSGAFAGSMDEVEILPRPASADEIARMAEAGRSATADAPRDSEEVRRTYVAIRAVKRRIMLKSPEVDFSKVLFIDQPYPQGAEWQHQARHRNGMMAMPGGRLLLLDGLQPGGRLTKLAPEKPGAFWSPDVSFDGKRVLFCMKPWDEGAFHLYEIGADGSGLKQLTSGPYDDIDPVYLPDGHIAFSSSRSNSYVRCMPYTFSYVLARCDADGGNVYLISQNSEPDWCPTVMNDGRLIYSRWEYTDKALWRIQSLWTTNPDGTGTATFWGNQSVWPDHLAEPRAIPGSNRVMFTGLAHHNWFAGSIGILDPAKGRNFPHGLTKVTAEAAWPECGRPPLDPKEKADYHTSGRFGAYKTPYPLSETLFLVSADRKGKFALYLMDVWGNRELIYEGAHHIWHAIPLRARQKPPAYSSRVAWPGTGRLRKPKQPGTFFSANVTEGAPELRGKVAALRVIAMDPKTYSQWTRDGRYSGPSLSGFQEEGYKRILGTAPVAADGSVNFTAPAGVPLHFQLLDRRGRALQTMRSFSGLMPGEKRGCVGCHELHSVTPATRRGTATVRPPAELLTPSWGQRTVSYGGFARPVLAKHCGSCHTGAGAGRRALDLTERPSGVWGEPYLTLVNSGLAGALKCEDFAQSDPRSYVTMPPMQHLSYASRLVDMASSGTHYGVRVAGQELQMLIAWVDANCPSKGEEEVRAMPDPAYPGLERLSVRPRCGTAPVIPRP